MSEQDVSAALAALRQMYASELPERLAQINAAWEEVRARPGTQSLRALHMLAHRLAGSAACYNFDAVSARARAVETHVQAMLEGAAPADDLGRLEELLQALREAVTPESA